MKAEDHTQWVGGIVTNLQALETVLRYFLAKLRNEVVEFPKPGDQTVNQRWNGPPDRHPKGTPLFCVLDD